MRFVVMLILIITALASFNIIADDYVNICGRGVIGKAIADQTNSLGCDRVNIAHLKSLPFLDLSHEIIKDISSADFDGLESVEILDLSSNPIEKIPSLALKQMPKLRRLNLSYCEIKTVHQGAFKYSRNLTDIKLDRNNIESIDSNAFKGPRKINSVDLYMNPIEMISLSQIGLSADIKIYYGTNTKVVP